MLRITGGEFRGRVIQAPEGTRTRPTQARLRQALFNSLQTMISEARVLDLFAGSGALGFEALSWGASDVVFVESARAAAKLIEKNAAALGVTERVKILAEPLEGAFKRLEALGPFDLVVADPPYAGGWETRLLEEFPWAALRDDGIVCIEWGTQKSKAAELPERTPQLVKIREKNYGDSVLTTFRKELS